MRRIALAVAVLLVLSLAAPVLAAPGKFIPPGLQKLQKRLEEVRPEPIRVQEQAMEMLMFGPPGLVQKVMPFLDMAPAQWALGYVARAQAHGLIRGYGDGTFQPMAAVKKAEAVAMVIRALGLEEEAQAITEVPNVPGIAACTWASGYIVLAVEKGLISQEGFEPNSAASRLWVTVLLVKAAGLPLGSGTLDLVDADEVPAELAPYVAAAIAAGLVTGYEDGSFRPHRAVSRAEMAALIDRLMDLEPTNSVAGTITALSATHLALDGVQLALAPDVVVFINDEHASYADLRVGYAARVVLDGDGRVAVINARTVQVRYEGVLRAIAVSSITVEVEGVEYTLTVTGDTVVELSGQDAALTDLRAGDAVEVLAQDGTALKIEATAAVTVLAGVVESVSVTNNTLDLITAESDAPVRVNVASGVVVKQGDSTLSFAELRAGDVVRVSIMRELAVLITVVFRPTQPAATVVTGTLTAVASNGVTVDDFVVPVSSGTVVTLDGASAVLADLRVGDTVTVTVVSGVATKVEAQARLTSLLGVVKAKTAESLVLLTASGEVTVTVSAGVSVTLDGQPVTFSSVAAGDTLVVTIRREVATAIEVIPRATVDGQVTVIVASGEQRTLTIQDASQAEHTGELAPSAVIMYGDAVLAPTDITAGDMVRVRFGADGKIYSLTITAKYVPPQSGS